MNRTILLTGFEPFGKNAVNPSLIAAMSLDGREIGGFTVRFAGLPVSWNSCGPALHLALDRFSPSITLLTGLQPAPWFSVERAAHNLDDATEPDNDGSVRIESPIRIGGPSAYWSTLPVAVIARALVGAGFKAAVSGSAGFYLCNHAFYILMDRLAEGGGIGGFIHVPPTKDLMPTSPFTQEDITRAVETALMTCTASP